MTEVVAFYEGFSAIYIRETGFQGLISRLFRGGGSLNLQNDLKNPLQALFGILEDKKYNSKNNSNGKICF